jgi:hypothetical protein
LGSERLALPGTPFPANVRVAEDYRPISLVEATFEVPFGTILFSFDFVLSGPASP